MPETQDLTQDSLAVRNPARRTIVKGAAWAVPAVTIASAAPAMANSPIPPNGLNGWVTLSRQCNRNNGWFQVDGRGNFTGGGANDRGIWTFVPDPNAQITFAEIIFYFNRNNFTFTNRSEGNGWTNLNRFSQGDGVAPAGHYAYRALYTGNWTWFQQYQAWSANDDPWWTTNSASNTCNTTVTGYARRTITVNGETVAFMRGPVSV